MEPKELNQLVRGELHVAVLKNSRISLLVSLDRDFDALNMLKRLAPTVALSLVSKTPDLAVRFSTNLGGHSLFVTSARKRLMNGGPERYTWH